MTTDHAEGVVVASLLATGVLDSLHSISQGHAPSLRQGLGLTIAGIFLALLAGPAPAVAAGFAVLMLIAAAFTVGDAALSSIGKALS